MGIGRILVGTLFCLAASILLVFFVTLGYSASEFTGLGITATYQMIFPLLLHPLTAIYMSHWSILAALAVGGLFGGLVAKSPGGGLLAGLLSFIVIFVLFLGLSIGFDFDAWVFWVSGWSNYIVVDVLLSAGILAGMGAIGGKITAGND